MINTNDLKNKLTSLREELEDVCYTIVEAEGEELQELENKQADLESEIEQVEETIAEFASMSYIANG